VMDPSPAPGSPLPVLNLPDSSELVQVRELPSVVSFSVVVPAFPVTRPLRSLM